MWDSLLKILAALVQWLTNRPVVDTRVTQLEETAAAERRRDLEDFDAKAAAVRDADGAIELLKDATRKPPAN
jgi:hypothetical protein